MCRDGYVQGWACMMMGMCEGELYMRMLPHFSLSFSFTHTHPIHLFYSVNIQLIELIKVNVSERGERRGREKRRE
jgi:hypothetical protein